MEILVIAGLVVLVAAVVLYRTIHNHRSGPTEPPDKEGNLR